uniref:Enhancer of filamentation 1 n=1 Tax=Sphaerodactylus townsendi TaxID=933632 RepID=A0ACB8FCK8_9SAUR
MQNPRGVWLDVPSIKGILRHLPFHLQRWQWIPGNTCLDLAACVKPDTRDQRVGGDCQRLHPRQLSLYNKMGSRGLQRAGKIPIRSLSSRPADFYLNNCSWSLQASWLSTSRQNKITTFDLDPGKEEFERQQKELLEKENIIKQSKMQLEHHQLNQFQWLEQEITKPVENDISKWKPPQGLRPANSLLASQDRQLLLFYSDQCETHFISLLNAIDAFFSCISATQPPRIFVAHSKFVILSAHKLVFIGDTLTRQLATQEIRNSVMNSSNQLCELLKNIVMATKGAALNYPSTASLQEMVDRVTELSHYAQLFKRSLVQMASY